MKINHKKNRLQYIKAIIVVFTLLLLGTAKNAQAQFNPVQHADSQLRALFSPLWHPVPGPGFLHDMAVHLLDSVYYDDICNDTLNRDEWFKIYEEMRSSAYDTTQMITFDSLYTLNMEFEKDTIAMNILAYDYLQFNDSALSSNYYYTADTVNNELIENGSSGELNPYLTKSIFASCPVSYFLPYKTVTYRIDPAFIFHDTYNDFIANNWELRIDFGDGMGFQPFNTTVVTHYVATYNAAGPTYITTEVFNINTATVIKCSQAEVIASSRVKPTPQQRISSPGFVADVWEPCSESGEPFKKVIIYVEGIDLQDHYHGSNRTTADIYQYQIVNNNIDHLLNFGYTIVVVDWKNSRRDIKDNAAYLQGLLDELKCRQSNNPDVGTHEQFVIIAESMGGLVARYALCDYEQNYNNIGSCLLNKRHNTRLLITVDSPHEGANIPLALQATYRLTTRFLSGASSLTQWVAGKLQNGLLDATASKQMLVYHIDTYNPFNGNVSQHQKKTDFDNDLANVGDFPQYCKMVALANGSIAGINQTHFYDTFERTPNDFLLDFQRDQFIRIWRQDIQLLGTNLKLRTAPNGSGNVTENSIDFYKPKIKITIKNWKLKIVVTSTYFWTLADNVHVNNVKPYDVAPGSTENYNSTIITDNINPSGGAFVFLFGLNPANYNFTNNTWTAQASFGNNVHGASLNMSMYTDGMHYCYIPTISALNYNTSSLFFDIENETIANKVNNTPFHVISGITEEYTKDRGPLQQPPITQTHDFIFFNIYRYQRQHTNIRTDRLGEWHDLGDTGTVVRYPLCEDGQGLNLDRQVYWLNREIGDDTLLIENRECAWECLYDAETFISVDAIKSDYYEYPSHSTIRRLPGTYSKEEPYTSSDITHFFVRSDTLNIWLATSFTDPYVKDTIDWVRCCEEQGQLKPGKQVSVERGAGTVKETLFLVYPNPAHSGKGLIVSYMANKDSQSEIVLYNTMGKGVVRHSYNEDRNGVNSTYELNLQNYDLPQGVYILMLKNGANLFKKTVVIHK